VGETRHITEVVDDQQLVAGELPLEPAREPLFVTTSKSSWTIAGCR